MKEVTRYISDRGGTYETAEEAEREEQIDFIEERLKDVWPDEDIMVIRQSYNLRRDVAKDIEKICKALNITFDFEDVKKEIINES